jgi:hypothetical protein
MRTSRKPFQLAAILMAVLAAAEPPKSPEPPVTDNLTAADEKLGHWDETGHVPPA